MALHLLIAQEVLSNAASAVSSPVYGRARLTEGLLQILSSTSSQCSLFEEMGGIRLGPSEEGEVRITDGEACAALRLREGLPLPETVEVVAVADGMDRRRVDVLGEGGVRARTVLLVGAGSLGSQIGLLLAEAGVGHFFLVDNERLDATNLSRHACDVLDLGREKSIAVADLLKRRSVGAEPVVLNVCQASEDALGSLVSSSDLVVATTDSPAAQFLVNDLCLARGRAGLFVGAYERACGGEVVLVQPGKGPCLFCAVGFRAQIGEGVGVRERRQAYQAADANRLVAEPGLGADIAYLASVAIAYALAVLDPSGSRADLLQPDLGFALIHGGSRPRDAYAELFRQPFDLIHARARHP